MTEVEIKAIELINIYQDWHTGDDESSCALALICVQEIMKSLPTKIEMAFKDAQGNKIEVDLQVFSNYPFWQEVEQYLKARLKTYRQ